MSNTTINFPSPSNRPTQTETSAPVNYAAKPLTPNTVNQTDRPVVSIKTDQAKLSVASGLITKALSGSDVRTEKVASLQKAIASGTYQVSSAKVADKLLQSLLGE